MNGLDNALLDDTSAAEYLRRAAGAVDRFATSSVTDKATTRGKASGDVAVAVVDAAVAHGGAAVAEATAGRAATAVATRVEKATARAAEIAANRRGIVDIIDTASNSPLPMQGAVNMTEARAGASAVTGPVTGSNGSWVSPEMPGSSIRVYTTTADSSLVRVSPDGSRAGAFMHAPRIWQVRRPKRYR